MGIQIDIHGDLSKCGSDCGPFLAKWSAWCNKFDGERLALIKIDRDYFNHLNRKSRQMITKSQRRGYTYRRFNYNDYLQDIYEINTSKEERQNKPMAEGYLEYPTPISSEFHRCDTHKYLRVGGFKDSKMYAYCAVAFVNELAILNTIIGHADALTDGVMNGLIDYLVRICDDGGRVKYLNYLTMESSGESLQAFKRSVGFESYEVRFV